MILASELTGQHHTVSAIQQVLAQDKEYEWVTKAEFIAASKDPKTILPKLNQKDSCKRMTKNIQKGIRDGQTLDLETKEKYIELLKSDLNTAP